MGEFSIQKTADELVSLCLIVTFHRILICWYSHVNKYYIWIFVIFLKIKLHIYGQNMTKTVPTVLHSSFVFFCMTVHITNYLLFSDLIFYIGSTNVQIVYFFPHECMPWQRIFWEKMCPRGWIIRFVLPFVALKLSIWVSYYFPMNALRTNRSVLTLSIIKTVWTQK